jgi:hypothetical protein
LLDCAAGSREAAIAAAMARLQRMEHMLSASAGTAAGAAAGPASGAARDEAEEHDNDGEENEYDGHGRNMGGGAWQSAADRLRRRLAERCGRT